MSRRTRAQKQLGAAAYEQIYHLKIFTHTHSHTHVRESFAGKTGKVSHEN